MYLAGGSGRLDGARIRVDVYGPEKSIADAFKYRNKLGLELGLEALRIWYAADGT